MKINCHSTIVHIIHITVRFFLRYLNYFSFCYFFLLFPIWDNQLQIVTLKKDIATDIDHRNRLNLNTEKNNINLKLKAQATRMKQEDTKTHKSKTESTSHPYENKKKWVQRYTNISVILLLY